MKDNLTLRGNVVIKRVRKDGTVLDTEEIKNLVVSAGKERVAKLINGIEATYFRAIGIGTGSTSPVIGNTALETEVARELATLTYEASNKAVFTKTFIFGSGESYSITEAGIFDSAVESGSTMLDRFTFTARAVDSDTDLLVEIKITVN